MIHPLEALGLGKVGNGNTFDGHRGRPMLQWSFHHRVHSNIWWLELEVLEA